MSFLNLDRLGSTLAAWRFLRLLTLAIPCYGRGWTRTQYTFTPLLGGHKDESLWSKISSSLFNY
eukprot:8744859-Heterocapsa_arctica.AAC.1